MADLNDIAITGPVTVGGSRHETMDLQFEVDFAPEERKAETPFDCEVALYEALDPDEDVWLPSRGWLQTARQVSETGGGRLFVELRFARVAASATGTMRARVRVWPREAAQTGWAGAEDADPGSPAFQVPGPSGDAVRPGR